MGASKFISFLLKKSDNLRHLIDDGDILGPKEVLKSKTPPVVQTTAPRAIVPDLPQERKPSALTTENKPVVNDVNLTDREINVMNAMKIMYKKLEEQELNDLDPGVEINYNKFDNLFRSLVISRKNTEAINLLDRFMALVKAEREGNTRLSKDEAMNILLEKYNRLLEIIPSSGSGLPNFQRIKQEFLRQTLQDPNLAPYVNDFLSEISKRTLPGERPPIPLENGKDKNLSSQEIRGLIYFKGIDKVRELPEIINNDVNYETLERVSKEIVDEVGINRESLAKEFLSNYLKLSPNKEERDSETNNRLFQLLIDNRANQSLMDDEQLAEKLRRARTDDNSKRLSVSDSLDFIEHTLFMPDRYGKEYIGKFMIDQKPEELLRILRESGAEEETVDLLKSNILTRSKSSYNTIQNHDLIREYYPQISEYIMSLIKSKDKRFFDWAMKEAFRNTNRGANAFIRQAPSAKGKDGDEVEIDFADNKEEYNERQKVNNEKILKDNGLKSSADDGSDSITPQKIKSFFDNYKKIKSYYQDLIKGLDATYSRLITSDKSTALQLLQKKAVILAAFKVADVRINNMFMKGHNRYVPVGDIRIKHIINQDWSSLVEAREIGQAIKDNPETLELAHKAVEDGLLPREINGQPIDSPEQAFLDDIAVSDAYGDSRLWLRLKNFESFMLSDDMIKNHSREAIISFVDMIGVNPKTIALGTLLAKNNSPSIVNAKVEYLTELVRRGVITTYTEDQIENMTIEEIDHIFKDFRADISGFFGSIDNRIQAIVNSSRITDSDIYRISDGVFSSKEDLIKKTNDKIGKAKLKEVVNNIFNQTYYDSIKYPANDYESLYKHLKDQVSKKQKEDESILSKIHIDSVDEIDSLPPRRVQQIAKVYFPELYDAFRYNLLRVNKTFTKEEYIKIIEDVKSRNISPLSTKSLPSGGLQDALVFAKILDLPRNNDKAVQAAINMRNIKTATNIKKMILFRKLAKFINI